MSVFAKIFATAMALSLLAGSAIAKDVATESPVYRGADESIVEGGIARLTRMDHGVFVTFDSIEMKPGHAVTLWWVIMDNPAMCGAGTGVCGLGDMFHINPDYSFILNDDGTPPLNVEGMEATVMTMGYGSGHVIDETGAGHFQAQLSVGDTSTAMFGKGLQNPFKAEIHIVLRDHGIAKPGMIDEMIHSYNGGCDADLFPHLPCDEFQFAMFPPAN